MSQQATVNWESYARDYDALNALNPYHEMLKLVTSYVPKNGKLLDASCGTGNLEIRLPNDSLIQVTGVDSSQEMLARAKQKHKENQNFSFVFGDLNKQLDFPHNFFDSIACVNTLYAVDDPIFTLREFKRVLTPNGTLIVVTPKVGFENGIILKAHCRSTEEDEHWANVHSSEEREHTLIKEALGETEDAEAMLRVASHI